MKALEYDSLFKKSFYAAFGLTAGTALVMLVIGRIVWGLGVLAGGAWMFINFFLLFHLLKLGMSYNNRLKNKIVMLCVIKFPVLYTAGYFILVSRFFPVASLLIGLSIFFVVMISAWLRMCMITMNAPKVYEKVP